MPLAEKPIYIHEPTPLQCGQAVLAMLSGVSVEEIISVVGTERETTLKQMFSCRISGGGINGDARKTISRTRPEYPPWRKHVCSTL